MERTAAALGLALVILSAQATGLAADCTSPSLKVAVDVGHSLADPGTESATGRSEYAFNARLARELVRYAKTQPRLRLFIINPDGQTIALPQRPELAKAKGADILVSIHHDAVNDRYQRPWTVAGKRRMHSDAFRGFGLFVSKDNPAFEQSRRLAERIGRQLKDSGFQQSLHHAEPIPNEGRQILNWELGIYDAPFVVVKTAQIPAVLIEAGVIVHKAEEKLLNQSAYRRRLAMALLRGLASYCNAVE